MKLYELVEYSGKLVRVESFSFPELLNDIACIKLSFENMICYIGLDEESDEIMLSKSFEKEALVKSSNNEIWQLFIGKELLWVWELINNQGYSDGIKLEFKEVDTSVELIVIASTLKIYSVNET